MARDYIWAKYFDGRPFEGTGAVLSAIHCKGPDYLLENLPKMYAGFKYEPRNIVEYGDYALTLSQFANAQSIRLAMLVLLKGKSRNRDMEIVSLYPVMDGIINRLYTRNFNAWSNGYEGMIAAGCKNFGSISFFDPFYFQDKKHLRLNAWQIFNMAAVALDVQIAENEEFEISDGPLYSLELKSFMKANPDKTEADFENPIVSLGVCQYLLPTEYTGEYEFRAQVIGSEQALFLNNPMLRFHISFGLNEEEEGLEMWLYASEHIINGRFPRVGEYIEGHLWTAGFLANK